MKKLSVEIDGQQVSGFYQKTGDQVWIHLQGKTWCVQAEPTRRKRKNSAGANDSGSDIAAPMPGKINKVEVQAGDAVAVNQVLVVMEAMKMEYTLKAKVNGKVESVHCSVGDQVAFGQVLVQVQPQSK